MAKMPPMHFNAPLHFIGFLTKYQPSVGNLNLQSNLLFEIKPFNLFWNAENCENLQILICNIFISIAIHIAFPLGIIICLVIWYCGNSWNNSLYFAYSG